MGAVKLTDWAMKNPRRTIWLTIGFIVLALIGFLRVQVDTDPENMLSSDDPVRVTNREIDERFGSGQLVVAAVIADDTIATADRLSAVIAAHNDIVMIDGVIADETVSLAVLTEAPSTDRAAQAAFELTQYDALFAGNVISSDGTAATWFVSIANKNDAAEIADEIDKILDASPALAGLERHVAGLPLAQDAFGQQMFIQMAVFAPLAGLLVFALMFFFFRRLALVLPAMAVAMATVILTMGALIGSGSTLHIMSSMIPIFLMPIAILDSVHVLSEFFDRYPETQDREATIRSVIGDLLRPLTFTSLTTGVGFAALALTPIPPVRVFGLFVALGVFFAWLLTITLLPALIVRMNPDRLATLAPHTSRMGGLGEFVTRRRLPIVAAFVLLALAAVPALTLIQVNDNPVRWFRSDHEVRVATERLNQVLPGTFGANLIVRADEPGGLDRTDTRESIERLVAVLEQQEIVGAVQAYTDAEHPVLIDGDVANIRLQLRSGDNVDMQSVVDVAEDHLGDDPIIAASTEWAGETYLNLRWQDKMVNGMLTGFFVTVAIVFLLLVGLFRSVRWALLAILPVLWTVLVVYGVIGWVGKDFDMPIAVLSTLVLGIGVDFAIHYVERFRALRAAEGTRAAAIRAFFGEPSTALTRNAVVIAVGFTPLFLSSLVPYVVVGAFLAGIIALSWLATLLLLPALTPDTT